MTKQAKISLSGAKEIPFNSLFLSQANVRRVKAGVSIDTLAADIARRGLLTSLAVRAEHDGEGNETGRYEVPAGGRRYRALQMLVKQRRMTRTEPVPCIVRENDDISAEEDSLAENIHREPLHPLDQFRSMQKLVEQGTDIETVAATFMVTPAVVRQRLKLASVSPTLHEIYADDGMTLEQLMAFSVAADHARQEQVWEMLQTSGNQQPWFIRARLTEDKVRASDKRVRFVTLAAYIEAGGHVLRDLFESDDGGWLEDVALLDRLQTEKLDAEVAAIAAEGWKWVEAAVDFQYGHTYGLREIDGEAPEANAEDEARVEALREEADRLEDEWAGQDEIPDEVSARIEAIDEEIAPLVSKPLIYDPAEVAIAGAFVSIDVDGSLHVERGYVRPEDEPANEPDDAATDPDGADAGDEAEAAGGDQGAGEAGPEGFEPEDPDDLVRPLPDKLVTDLTAHRTLALRDIVAGSPRVAFAAMLHALALECFYTYASSASCVGIALRSDSLVGQRAAQERDSARASRLFLGGEGAASHAGSATSGSLPPTDGAAEAPVPDSRRQFLAARAKGPIESAERIISPSSPYILQAGSLIPAALVTGIRSDLPGQISAQVTQNVYDSPTGRILLIPQGARLLGEYDSEIAAGQSRVLLAWDRLILPGGRSIRLDRQPGADASGMAGLEDRVNNHWGRMLRAALVSTLLGVGSELSVGGEDDLARALRYGVQDSAGEAGRRVVERELAVRPTLSIRPGFAFRVIVARDLVLEPMEMVR